jgi:hypothetical protein
MKNAVYYVSYKLKKGADVAEFLLASERLMAEHISKQAGYISWKQLAAGDLWADMCTFRTMEDLQGFLEASKTPGEAALNFYSFINLPSCKSHYFTVEKSYE